MAFLTAGALDVPSLSSATRFLAGAAGGAAGFVVVLVVVDAREATLVDLLVGSVGSFCFRAILEQKCKQDAELTKWDAAKYSFGAD